MTATCGICREIMTGKRAPARHEAPDAFEWQALCDESQRHFARRHPDQLAAIQIVTRIWVHYLLSLHLLFTDEKAIALQTSIVGDLQNTLAHKPGRVEVIDLVPADAGSIDRQTLLPANESQAK